MKLFKKKWNGRKCVMCYGKGVARFIPGDGKKHYARCPACNGHGREPK